MTNSITNRQMAFILYITLATGTTISIATKMAQTAGRSSWIPLLMVSLVFGAAAVVTTKLSNMYQGEMLFDYCRHITGSLLRYIICSYYMIYFFIINLYLLMTMADFVTENFLPQTPHIIMIGIVLLLLGYTAYKGLQTIARIFEIIGILVLVVTILLCIFILTQGMRENVLPFFNPNEVKFFPKAIKVLIIPFGGIEILLMIPLTSQNRKAPVVGLFTVLAIGLINILITESTIMILGLYNTSLLSDSMIEAIRLIDFPIIERTDIFYLTFGFMGLFSGLIIIFTAVVEYACRIFPKPSRFVIIVVIGFIMFMLFLVMERINISLYEKMIDNVISILILIAGILIPSVLLIVAKIRNRITGYNRGDENETIE